MKKLRNIIWFITLFLALGSCTKNEWENLDKIQFGYSAAVDTLNSEILVTKDYQDNSVIFENIDVDVAFKISTSIENVKSVGVKKSIYNASSKLISSTTFITTNNVNDSIVTQITSTEELFSGLNFSKDSIQVGYYFEFSTFLENTGGDTIVTTEGNFIVNPEYLDFCTLPTFPQGIWEAYNKATGFKKYVGIEYLEIASGVWFWVITDFGLDWSNWNDFWYGTDFTLECPFAGDDRFVVRLASWGTDLPNIRYEMKNDNGVLETRGLRLMPYKYADEANPGFYDAVNKQFVFKNIQVIDTWWNSDNHLIEDLTITYVGEN